MNKFVLFMLLFFFAGGSFLGTLSSVSASRLVEDTWNMKTPMEQARTHLGVVAVEGKIYAIGGAYGTGSLGTNECYDPVMDTWTTLESMPTARADFAIAAYEGKIYCIGGSTAANYSVNGHYYEPPPPVKFSVNEVYDPNTDSWSTKASMPVSNNNLQAHVVDGKIFVIDVSGNLFMYDPATDLWTKKTSAPIPAYSETNSVAVSLLGFSTILNNKILVYHIQYHFFPEFSSKFLVYDPKTDKWSDKNTPSFMPESSNSSAPFSSKGFTGVTSGVYAPQRIYVFSGNYYGSTSNDVLIYDQVDDIWLTAKGMPTNRWSFGVAVVDDVLYIIGDAINGQYVPIGYRSTAYTTPTQSNSNPPEQSNPTRGFITCIIVAVVALTVGIVAALFFYFNKKKAGMRYTSPIQQQYKGYVKYN